MSYATNTDLLYNLRRRVNALEIISDKHNMRLNKLEDGRDDKVMPEEVEGVDFSHTIPGKGYETASVKIDPDPSKLESNKDYALDWYINQYQNMCKEYNKVKVKLDEKQKVLEQVMDQRGRYVKQLMDAEKSVKELEGDNKQQQNLIELFEAANLDMAKKIKDLEHKNMFLSDLNNAYRKMVMKEGE